MSKVVTPAMERARRKAAVRKDSASPMLIAWRELRRNKLAMFGLAILIVFVLVALFPGVISGYEYDEQNYSGTFAAPFSAGHSLGTDNLGRDILTRLAYGTRISLGISIVAVAFSLFVGGIVGTVTAFYGGKVDSIVMRIIDILQSIPAILLALSIATALGKGIVNMALAIGISSIPPFARMIRAAVLTVKDRQYVEAGRCLGASDVWMITRHMIPNALGPIIVQTTYGIVMAILTISSLSYVGLGLQPPTPEWGGMLSDGYKFIQQSNAWHLTVIPGLAIIIVSFGLNVLGDGLRDAFDPKLR